MFVSVLLNVMLFFEKFSSKEPKKFPYSFVLLNEKWVTVLLLVSLNLE